VYRYAEGRCAWQRANALGNGQCFWNAKEQVKLKTTIRNVARQLADVSVALAGKTTLGRHLYGQIVSNAMNRTQQVTHHGSKLTFAIPNALSKFRAESFSTKEPETLEWIDEIPRGSVLWDIGANVGIYTCYAAKARGSRVIAFEPSVFNLELLARNIYLNHLTDCVTIVPLPLSNELSLSTLNMTSTEWGGALSTFGENFGHDGEPIRKLFEIPTIGLSMVDAIRLLKVPQPDYIKMDVDGIEHLILKGGMPVLLAAKGVLVEINDSFAVQADDSMNYLRSAGFTLKEKRHAQYLNSNAAARFTFNQIWVK
jgi:FkbM family methyltransferase